MISGASIESAIRKCLSSSSTAHTRNRLSYSDYLKAHTKDSNALEKSSSISKKKVLMKPITACFGKTWFTVSIFSASASDKAIDLYTLTKSKHQFEIAEEMSNIIIPLTAETAITWLKAGFFTLHRSWEELEFPRSKLLLKFVHFFLIAIYKRLEENSWDISVRKSCMKFLKFCT